MFGTGGTVTKEKGEETVEVTQTFWLHKLQKHTPVLLICVLLPHVAVLPGQWLLEICNIGYTIKIISVRKQCEETFQNNFERYLVFIT